MLYNMYFYKGFNMKNIVFKGTYCSVSVRLSNLCKLTETLLETNILMREYLCISEEGENYGRKIV